MAKRKSKESKEYELDKLNKENKDLVTIDLPTHFPFKDVMCLKEHQNLFQDLFKAK